MRQNKVTKSKKVSFGLRKQQGHKNWASLRCGIWTNRLGWAKQERLRKASIPSSRHCLWHISRAKVPYTMPWSLRSSGINKSSLVVCRPDSLSACGLGDYRKSGLPVTLFVFNTSLVHPFCTSFFCLDIHPGQVETCSRYIDRGYKITVGIRPFKDLETWVEYPSREQRVMGLFVQSFSISYLCYYVHPG